MMRPLIVIRRVPKIDFMRWHRFGFAFVEGAGGAPSVFATKLNDLFDVSLPVKDAVVPLVTWIKSLPAGQRPATAAFRRRAWRR